MKAIEKIVAAVMLSGMLVCGAACAPGEGGPSDHEGESSGVFHETLTCTEPTVISHDANHA